MLAAFLPLQSFVKDVQGYSCQTQGRQHDNDVLHQQYTLPSIEDDHTYGHGASTKSYFYQQSTFLAS